MSANHSIIARHARRVTPELVRDMHAAQDDMGAWAEISRDRIMAVTGRVPLELVHDASIVAACRGGSCHQVRQPCRERCGAEMGGGTSGDAPTVPTRRLPTKPRLSPMRRLVQWLTELSARIRRT